MKHFSILIIALITSLNAAGQKSGQTDFEIGGSIGFSWYNGDLNQFVYFGRDYMHNSIGIHLRKNINQRFALRFNGMRGTVSANDQLTTSPFQTSRNLNFTSPLYELSSVLEFNFLEFDALLKKYRFSPYSFIGLGGVYFNPSTEIEGGTYELRPLATEGKDYNKVAVVMPFGFGLKWAITDRIILNAEWGMRKTFTDYIDDVSSTYPFEADLEGLSRDISDRSLSQSSPDGTNWGTQRGHRNTKDWYSFSMISLNLRLGPKKGSCKHLRI